MRAAAVGERPAVTCKWGVQRETEGLACTVYILDERSSVATAHGFLLTLSVPPQATRLARVFGISSQMCVNFKRPRIGRLLYDPDIQGTLTLDYQCKAHHRLLEGSCMGV
ncbi:hypothetical protein AcW1_000293 [Taiwanofungus camphoratus]|nr:hypothetical protein AcW1_000293 [Antrodia cinnamomea]